MPDCKVRAVSGQVLRNSQERFHYPYIDVLRAAAALLVLVYHVIALGSWTDFPTSGAARVFRFGWIGVDLFFVISGFVITLSAVSGYRRHGSGFRGEYLWRRWLRIAPLYFATILFFLLLVRSEVLLEGIRTAAIHILSHATFLHNMHPATHGSINGPNWSVALEVQFYLLVALIAPWLSRSHPLKVLALFITVSWAYRYATTLVLIPGQSNTHEQFVYASQLVGALDAFGIGIALALFVLVRDRINPFGLFSASWRSFAFWLICAVAAFWLSMRIFSANATYWDSPWMITSWRTILSLGMGGVVACAVTIPLRTLGAARPLAYLGTISYGIYLWHTPVLLSLLEYQWLRGTSLLLWTAAGTIVLSAASWHFFEKQFLAKKAA